MNRKQRRPRDAQIRKDGNEELATKVALFGQLPEECTACEAAYDKNNKEMATTWNVVVREKENKVNLYCPPCWNDAKKFIQEMKEKLNESKNKKDTP